ncbi:MAG: cytochrome c [Bacteroidetes bacterium]|nr:cytochrome c [Bacteroidota bacterium]
MSQQRADDGRSLFKSRGCAGCHGDIENGVTPPVELPTQWRDAEGNPILVWPRNFAVDPLKRPRLQDIFKTIRLGIKGTPMPANPVSDEETWNLIAYVLHLKQLGSEGKIPPK